MPTQLASEPIIRPPPQGTPSPLATELETLPLPRLQEKIWTQAYNDLRAKEPELVEAFEKIISTKLQLTEASAESAGRTGNDVTINQEARSHQMRQLVQDGLDQTKKEAFIKQGIDDGLQAVYPIRGIMNRAVRAAPEAAIV